MSTRWPLGGGWVRMLQVLSTNLMLPLIVLVTCRHGEDVVIHHNHLRDEMFNLRRCAHLSVSVEKGHGH